jgi:hypothetical protein
VQQTWIGQAWKCEIPEGADSHSESEYGQPDVAGTRPRTIPSTEDIGIDVIQENKDPHSLSIELTVVKNVLLQELSSFQVRDSVRRGE